MTDSEKMDLLLEKFTGMDDKVTSIDARVTNIDNRVTNIDTRVAGIEKDTRDIKLIIENEIRVNIQRVAEGHLDLSRNLHDAMKPSNEIEMLAIKVRMLESDMREVKHKIS